MDLQKLKIEIENDPEAIGYDYLNKTADEILTLLTTKNRTRKRVLSSAELVAWAAAEGRLVKIQDAGTDSNYPPTVRSIALAASLLLTRDGTTLDLNLTDRQQLVGGLVQAGVLSADDSTALYALATETISRLEELNLGETHLGDVEWVITMINTPITDNNVI